MPKLNRPASRFLICMDNKGYSVSLEKRKLYVTLPDAIALKHGQVRVIDESGMIIFTRRVSSCLLQFPSRSAKPF